MKYLFLIPILLACSSCATGEGNRTYLFGDVYITAPPGANLSVLNQESISETGRDRTTKPSLDLSVPVSAIPKP